MEIYQKYRPKTWERFVGQPEAVRVIQGLFAGNGGFPHAVMFVGPSGTGKTTAARIVARQLGAVDESNLIEIACATCEPLKEVRELDEVSDHPPLNGKPRVWILDEVQSLSRAQFAQQGLLAPLERRDDRAVYNYYMLCTTDPTKIIDTVRNRCTEIQMKSISGIDIGLLVHNVAAAEKVKLDKDVTKRLIELADGSARRALVMLEKVIGVEPAEAMEILKPGAEQAIGFDLVKLIMPFGPNPPWSQVAAVLRNLENEEPEDIRNVIMKTAWRHIVNNNPKMRPRAYRIVRIFEDPFRSGKVAGHAVLAANCLELFGGDTAK